MVSKLAAQFTTVNKSQDQIQNATANGLKIASNPFMLAPTNSLVITGCTTATHGLFPSNTITPNCSGNYETITSQSWAGEYSNVNVIANRQYSFSSSVTTDYITITNATGTVIYASGTQPVIWDSGSTTGVIRYYLHSNANCGDEQANRTRYIRCADASNCVPPSNLAVSNITSNSCKISWTAASPVPSSNYDIYIVTTNNAPDANSTPTLFSTTNLSTSISLNIAAGTTYYYWIRSNCGATTGSWISGGNFTSPPALTCNGAIYGLYPDATFTPACTGNVEQIVADAYAGEYSNVNVVTNRQYTFSSSVSTDFITVTNSTGTTVFASGLTPLNWLSGTYSGAIRYHINSNSSCGTQATNRIRRIQCLPVSTCGVPTNLVVSNITSNSCRFTWSPPSTAPSGYEVYLSTTNTAPVSATTATYTTPNTFIASVNPLTASTTYFYWVRSNCNGTKSNWVSGGSFTALTPLTCNGAIYGLFPEATFTPSCTGNLEQIVNNAYAGEFSKVNILTNKQYTFTSSVTTDFITITNEGGTAVLASGLTPVTWNSNFTGVIRYHINSNANCGTQATSRVRSIICATLTGCNAPTQLFTDPESATTVNIVWSASVPAPSNGYIYCYSTVNDPFSNNIITGTTTETFAVLNNLTPNTTYYFWIKANCGTTQSSWSTGSSFTTSSGNGCNAPTQLFYDGLTSTTNNIAWVEATPTPGNGYIYCYSTVNDPFSSNAITGTTNEIFATLENLSPNTTYYFWVKSDCGTSQSNWAAGPSFTTPSSSGCNAPTQLFTDPESATTVNIAWVEATPTPNNGYIYSYSTVNDPYSSNVITGTTTDTFAVLNNLTPNTTYYFWVKSNCGQTQSDWVSGPSFTTSILEQEVFSLDKIKLYPNPVKSIFTISLDKEISTVSVYNLLGEEVIVKTINANQTSINISELPAGTYLVKVNTEDSVKTVKVIKQ
jgi:phosphoribosyl-AMP cyclohydrolase